ncbi:P63C domain-containing protein [Reichenbachiella sp.]|uniref:P63C domain-containing protein n=1 Tax=Reichenbachiella sp. TaxID=2184521 RepID=UPI003BAEE37D
MKHNKNIAPLSKINNSTKETTTKGREDLKGSFLTKVEQLVKDELSDKKFDRESLKIELRSGIVLNADTIDFVTNKLQDYTTKFPQDYYREIFRLNRHRGLEWQIPESGLISQKPHIVGKWTNEIIYSRFGKEVLPVLELYNPYISIGIRKYKHHQFLDEDGLIKLEQFINESIDVMKKSNDWYDFRIKLYAEHNVPYQLELIL